MATWALDSIEHALKAEKLLQSYTELIEQRGYGRNDATVSAAAQLILMEAQVHATLATVRDQ